MWQEFQADAHDRDLAVSVQTAANPDRVRIDAAKLRIILRNVMQNAVCHCDRSGRIDLSTFSRPGIVGLQIDNTCTKEALLAGDNGHVFQRFWRGDSSRTQTGQHFGLGLSLVKRLAVALNVGLKVEVVEQAFRVQILIPAPQNGSRPLP